MNDSAPIFFLVRGLPGSGRSTAMREQAVRQDLGCGIILEGDPAGPVPALIDPTFRREARRHALGRLLALTEGPAAAAARPAWIALETAEPHAAELRTSILLASRLGLALALVLPQAAWMNDPEACALRSSRRPDPGHLRRLLAEWEPTPKMQAETFAQLLTVAERRALVADATARALACADPLEAMERLHQVAARFPEEAGHQQILAGPVGPRPPSERLHFLAPAIGGSFWERVARRQEQSVRDDLQLLGSDRLPRRWEGLEASRTASRASPQPERAP